MKILITGSTGFIGQAMTQRLQDNYELIHFKSDLNDHNAAAAEIKYHQPDVIVHLAAKTEVEKSFYEQVDFSQTNYVGTVNLIEAAAQLDRIPYFVFASTMEVYGHQPISDEVKTQGYTDNPVVFDEYTEPHPNAPYAVAKFGCEKYLEYAHRAYGLDYSIVRQTNSYGRSDNDFFVTEKIITQMLRGDVCNLGYRTPYRNFIYIDDLLDVWEILITQREKVKNNLFTIGPDDPRQIYECVDLIANKLNWDGEINWNTQPARPGEIWWLNSGNKRITDLTGWEPKISYEQGIDLTIEKWIGK